MRQHVGEIDSAGLHEIEVVLDAVLAHCFAKEVKPTLMTLWPAAPRLMQVSIERQAKRFDKVSGSDYAYLGYRPGNALVIIGLVGSV